MKTHVFAFELNNGATGTVVARDPEDALDTIMEAWRQSMRTIGSVRVRKLEVIDGYTVMICHNGKYWITS